MIRRFAVLSFVLLASSSAFGQVFYEPVRYQYGTENNRYLYGGNNPYIHSAAHAYSKCRATYGMNLHRFDGGNSFGQPSPMYNRERVFSDCTGTWDASWFGYNAADARNDAYANAPTYFRKADLINNAIVMPDGTRVVPNARPDVIMKVPAYITPRRRVGGGQIIIIPKNLLDRPVKDFEPQPKKVASANP